MQISRHCAPFEDSIFVHSASGAQLDKLLTQCYTLHAETNEYRPMTFAGSQETADRGDSGELIELGAEGARPQGRISQAKGQGSAAFRCAAFSAPHPSQYAFSELLIFVPIGNFFIFQERE